MWLYQKIRWEWWQIGKWTAKKLITNHANHIIWKPLKAFIQRRLFTIIVCSILMLVMCRVGQWMKQPEIKKLRQMVGGLQGIPRSVQGYVDSASIVNSFVGKTVVAMDDFLGIKRAYNRLLGKPREADVVVESIPIPITLQPIVENTASIYRAGINKDTAYAVYRLPNENQFKTKWRRATARNLRFTATPNNVEIESDRNPVFKTLALVGVGYNLASCSKFDTDDIAIMGLAGIYVNSWKLGLFARGEVAPSNSEIKAYIGKKF